MPNKPNGPVRRGQVISTFGVGARVVVLGGVSLMVSGLDDWFLPDKTLDESEFILREKRLENILNVSFFKMPPDFRDNSTHEELINKNLTLAAYRFPTWHFCPDQSCRTLYKSTSTERGYGGKIRCEECKKKNKTRYMVQVPVIALCENGHIQDFPWVEWVHKSININCDGKLKLISASGPSLTQLKVECECGLSRTLSNVTEINNGKTTLSTKLSKDPNEEYLCSGHKSWLGGGAQEPCGAQLKGSLSGAANAYFSNTLSSIYLPSFTNTNHQEIEEIFSSGKYSLLLESMIEDVNKNKYVSHLRKNIPYEIKKFTDEEIEHVIHEKYILPNSEISESLSQNPEDTLKNAEYAALKIERNDNLLKIRKLEMSEYGIALSNLFSSVMLISKLKETRVFTGFSRIFPSKSFDNRKSQKLLWRKFPENISERWLPANEIFGEGIFIEFNQDKLASWEKKKEVISRLATLTNRFKKSKFYSESFLEKITPRFVLIHTFSHLLINRLTFESGYSTASLRERLYVSSDPEKSMSGVLVYTANGDSEGTMGGLVRLGKPKYLSSIVQRSIENARWCSSDPVCMEIGGEIGQGPNGLNLAACHSCALVPETTCEEFNSFLDRGLLIGDLNNSSIGYFSDF